MSARAAACGPCASYNKSEKFCLSVTPEAPIFNKLLKIGLWRSAKYIVKNVPILFRLFLYKQS